MTEENLFIYYKSPPSLYIPLGRVFVEWKRASPSRHWRWSHETPGNTHTHFSLYLQLCGLTAFAFIYQKRTVALRICKYEMCVSNTLCESLEIWESQIGLQFIDMLIMNIMGKKWIPAQASLPDRIYNPITAMGFSAMFTFQLYNTKR